MRLGILVLLTVSFFAHLPAHAADAPEAVKKAIAAMLGEAAAAKTELQPAAVSGLYEAVIDQYVFYVSDDGQFILRDAEILDLKQNGKNLTEARLNGLRLKSLEGLKDADQVIFKPEGETKHVLRAFTDVDCFYCAKLHLEVAELNKAGVEVRYMAFPRAGMNSETSKVMESVWCADDRQKAMTDAKAGKDIEPKSCANPIAKQYELGKEMGINGTPALVMPDGQLFPGYAPAKKLVQYLNDQH